VAKAKFEVKACASTDFAFENKFALIILIKILRVIIMLGLPIINVQPVDAKASPQYAFGANF